MANLTLIFMDGTYGESSDGETWPDYAFLLSGIYLTVVFIFALIGNSIVIFLFAWDSHLRSPTNMFLLSLTISDWLVTVAGIPFVTSSIYAHRWLFAHAGCISYAFIMTFLGLNSLMSHAVIAVDRYLVITKPHFGIVVTYPKAFLMISVPWLFSFAWAVFPLAGWGEFTYEGTGAWCSVRWDSDEPKLMAYVLGMMFLTFVASILVMIYCYICIFLTMRSMPRWATSNSIKTHERNRRRRELKLVKTLVAIAIAYLLAWTPYAVTSMIAIFGQSQLLSVTASTLPSLFAKSSVMMNPIIYATTSRVFWNSFMKMLNSLCPGHRTWMKSGKSPPSSSKRTLPFSSDEKQKKSKDEQTSSVLVPGNTEICAAPIPASSPSRFLPDTHVKPGGKRLSAAIEMDRLNKLLPGKHKKGRTQHSGGRRPSDIAIPETGYKSVVNQVRVHDDENSQHNDDDERQTGGSTEGAVEIVGDSPPQESVTTKNNCSLELGHIIDGLHVKYTGRKHDAVEEEDKSCVKFRDIPEKDTKERGKVVKTNSAIPSDSGKEDRMQTEGEKTKIDPEYSSQSSVNADSGVFETNSAYCSIKKCPKNVQRENETEI